jgi:HK97 family phage major capsid protein
VSKLQELRAQRETAGKSILQLRDKIAAEGRDFNSEERAEWEKANTAFDALGAQIDAYERGDAVSKLLESGKDAKPGAEDTVARRAAERQGMTPEQVEEQRAIALQGWVLRQLGKPITDAHKRAAKLTRFDLRSKYLDVRLPRTPGELRAQSVGTTTAGGYTVPTTLVSSIEYGLKEWNAVRTVAEILRTDGGNPYDWPTVSDVSNVGTLLSENTTVGAAVDITFGKTTYNAYKFQSGLGPRVERAGAGQRG